MRGVFLHPVVSFLETFIIAALTITAFMLLGWLFAGGVGF